MNFNIKEFFTLKRVLFVFLFALLGWVALQINLFQYEGLTGKFFTWFEFIGPLSGAFLGPLPGALATFLSRIVNVIVFSKPLEAITIIPLFTLALGAFYFGSMSNTQPKSIHQRISLLIPLISIAIFLLHPVGREVWYYSLLWLIPLIVLPFQKHLFARALGSTFTAHSVGGALWIWVMPFAQTASYWQPLLLITPMERFIYAIGISISFIAFNTVLAYIESVFKTGVLKINPNYVIGNALLKN